MTRERLNLGKLGETLAIKKVRSLGYKVIVANYRCPVGELDLVAKDGDCLVFIEIKTRRRGAIDFAKVTTAAPATGTNMISHPKGPAGVWRPAS